MDKGLETLEKQDLMAKVVSLCKRRGLIFQSSEIYGGLKSCYDYGPLGVELKRNIANSWWKAMVYEREDILGLDASIIMHPKVWETSGHLAGFSDPLVDCRNCKERFRADKAPQKPPGSTTEYLQGGKSGGKKLTGTVSAKGYVCPNCSSSELSDERQFNLMFRTALGPIDPVSELIEKIDEWKNLDKKSVRAKFEEAIKSSAVYLRPETAQAMFVQFLNVVQSSSAKVPFGIAQVGKSFRNEIITEHFVFRSCEFEQMEMEYFVEPGTQGEWLEYWKNERMKWYKRYLNDGSKLRLRPHTEDELAHYADGCFDIEYAYPWGWGELEGIASRTDYDLRKHSEASGVKLSYFDQQKKDPSTGKDGWRYIPYVIEPAAGLTRTTLCILLDAYTEEQGTDAKGEAKERVFLKIHPSLAPIKVAVLPLVKKDGQPEKARELVDIFRKQGINTRFDENQSIGKRYAKHDEVGTPFCITIDQDSMKDGSVTIRERDDCRQQRFSSDVAVKYVLEHLQL